MKAFVITLLDHEYSEAKAQQCIDSGAEFGIEVERFRAIIRAEAGDMMRGFGLKWTWAKNNTAVDHCPISGLRQHPYGDLASKIACSMTHFLLWRYCFETDKPLLILEHDAVFLRPLPDVEFKGICQINDPDGATPYGRYWSRRMKDRGPGVFKSTKIFNGLHPDGLAGNSAYMIKPWAAKELIAAFHKYGVWPNDATMCIQLFPYLQELYPFVTRVDQTESTTSC